MVLNPDECSFTVLGVEDEPQIDCGNETLENSEQEKVWCYYRQQTQLFNITKNANSRFNALTTVQKYMTT